MMDLIEKESLCLAMMSESKKCCADCKTTKTPLWRGGPAGPKSLCNACGIRYRKRRVSMVGLSNVTYRKRDRSNGLSGATTTTSSNTTSVSTATTASAAESDGNDDRDLTESLERKLMALGKDLRLQRSPSVKKQRFLRRRKLKEEEQAAVCLMALSCDSIFA